MTGFYPVVSVAGSMSWNKPGDADRMNGRYRQVSDVDVF
jgi:hypothetical protein